MHYPARTISFHSP